MRKEDISRLLNCGSADTATVAAYRVRLPTQVTGKATADTHGNGLLTENGI